MAESEDFENLAAFSNKQISDQEAECQYLRSKVLHLEFNIKSLKNQLKNNGLTNAQILMDSNEINALRGQNERFLAELDEKKNIINEMQREKITEKIQHADEVLKLQKLLELQAPLVNHDSESSEASENSNSISDGLRQAVQFAIQQQKELEKLKTIIDTQNKKIRNLFAQLKSLQVTKAVPKNNLTEPVVYQQGIQCNLFNQAEPIQYVDPMLSMVDLNSTDHINIVPIIRDNSNEQHNNSNAAMNSTSANNDNDRNKRNNGNVLYHAFEDESRNILFNFNGNCFNGDINHSRDNSADDDTNRSSTTITVETENLPIADDLPTNVCIVCNRSIRLSQEDFEIHVEICIQEHSIHSPSTKICPVCELDMGEAYKQADFERHVERHFNQVEEEVLELA